MLPASIRRLARPPCQSVRAGAATAVLLGALAAAGQAGAQPPAPQGRGVGPLLGPQENLQFCLKP